MLNIPTDMQTRLDTGATTMSWCWRVTRADDQVFGFTEHDRDLIVDGMNFQAATGFVPGDMEHTSGFATDQASLFGTLNTDTITEAELARGIWDGARLDVLRVDWADPSLFVQVWTGEFGEIRRDEAAFEVDVLGHSYRLERTIGRLYSRHCDAELGDDKCGVDLNAAANTGTGSVTQITNPTSFQIDDLAGFSSGWFAEGSLIWQSGDNAGTSSRVRVHRNSGLATILEILEPPFAAIQIGDTAKTFAGCDKCLETCRDKFSNTLNFQGVPFMPGNDALIASPSSQPIKDGGSRNLIE